MHLDERQTRALVERLVAAAAEDTAYDYRSVLPGLNAHPVDGADAILLTNEAGMPQVTAPFGAFVDAVGDDIDGEPVHAVLVSLERDGLELWVYRMDDLRYDAPLDASRFRIERPVDPDAVRSRLDRRELDDLRFARITSELDPQDPRGHYRLGLHLLAAGRLEAADVAFEQVLRIEPGDADARYHRALIALAWGQSDFAAAELSRLIRRFPAADAPWGPLRRAVDGVLERAHLYAALFLAPAVLIALTATGPWSSFPIGALVAGALLAAALRWRFAARRVGPGLASLVRERLRRDPVRRVAVILDVVAIAALGIAALLPDVAAAGWIATLALVGATLLQPFQARPDS